MVLSMVLFGIKTHSIYAFDFIENNNRIDDYIKIITEIQKEPPYLFLGYSSGGNIPLK